MSNKDIAIKVNNVSKIYKLYDKAVDRLKESIHPFGKRYHKDFYALKNLSFEINKGDTIGIIGKNGSGKSTLLKMITGVLTPSSGTIDINGRVSALLELGAGFNPEFTGMENIYLNGTIMGYSKEEMDDRLDDIISFADIGDFINQPVKMYSSGMFVRLAFSVATSVQPDILIVDEALSVGDMFFQAKCMTRMKEMVNRGTTLLFVSHDTGAVKSVCQKCILLNDGEIIGYDKSDKMVEKYFAIKVQSEQAILNNTEEKPEETVIIDKNKNVLIIKNQAFIDNEEFAQRASFQRIQNGKVKFVNIQLFNEDGDSLMSLDYNQNVILRMAIEICEDIPTLTFGYHIRDKNGVDVVYSDSVIEDVSLIKPRKGEKIIIDWRFKTSLIHGTYNIACIVSIPVDLEIGKVDVCDYVPLAVQFNMAQRKGSMLYGSVHWDNLVDIVKVEG